MHRVSWICPDRPATWWLPDGPFWLPREVTHLPEPAALLLLGQWAALVTGDELVELPCRAPVSAGTKALAARLQWEPNARPRPAPLAPERTRGEDDERAGVELRLIDDDGGEIALAHRPVVVGRHPGCGLRLPDRRVSALHCAFMRDRGGVRVVDLGSSNGTYVDGARVRDVVLSHSATVSVGRSRLFVRAEAAGGDAIPLPSPAMEQVMALAARVARSNAPVLLHGESGVGKDVAARHIHRLSGRMGPFVTLNAAVLTPNLAGSELFGHTRGAFTGAESERDGAFVAAHGGTLFLDEIGELPLEVQAELLRAVEQRRIRRLGETEERLVDVRLITATHRDLPARVRSGQFREDLYHRLCVVPLTIPPLRARPEDIEAIAAAFLAAQSPPRALTARALSTLRAHRWPGNIRELLNVLRRACLLTDATRLDRDDLSLTTYPEQTISLDDLIHDTVVAVYDATGRSVVETARRLGIQRSTVYRHLRLEKPVVGRARAER